MLNVVRLQVLRAVAEAGSLTAAARELSYTPSAVSQQISLLERELDVQLVVRHRRGVRLTEAGRVLTHHAAAVLGELAAAEVAVAAVARGQGGRLRFGSFPTANATLMPLAVAAFRETHPGVDLELVELDGDEGVCEVAEHRLDIALTYEFPLVPLVCPRDLDTVTLLDDALRIMLPAGHPLAGRESLRLTELRDERWIQGARHGSTLDVLPLSARSAGFEADIVFRSDDQMAVRGLVAAGVGIALVSSLSLSLVPDGVVARRLDEPTLVRRIMVVVPGEAQRLRAADDMITMLGEVATS